MTIEKVENIRAIVGSVEEIIYYELLRLSSFKYADQVEW